MKSVNLKKKRKSIMGEIPERKNPKVKSKIRFKRVMIKIYESERK